MQTKNIAYKS